jgi:uncharacterized protein (DUF3820 family)
MAKLTENDVMPFGKHKGERMIDVPASYLLWWLENGKEGNVMDYCKENKEVLELEVKNQKK